MIQREQVALSNSKAHLSCLPSPLRKGGGTTSVQAPRETLLRAKGNHFPGGRASGVLPDSISTLLRPPKRAKDPDCSSDVTFSSLKPMTALHCPQVKPKLPDCVIQFPSALSPDSSLFSASSQVPSTLQGLQRTCALLFPYLEAFVLVIPEVISPPRLFHLFPAPIPSPG